MRIALFSLALLPVLAWAQDTKPADAKPAEAAKPAIPAHDTLLTNLTARNLGPTTMGGRITDLAVYEKEPRIFLAASASGGVWRTENGGITFQPIFYKEATPNVGAVAISQKDPNLIWVATGEGTSRNSVGWGDGVYKSTDGGKTWANMGLKECTHFSKIVIDPKNNDTVYAAGLGYLWGYNADRGVYKTTDGGKTWNKVLYVNEKTGAADMVMDPSNPNVLIVAMWEKLRKPYTWVSGGPDSAMYKTKDGGKTWKKITKGLPEAPIGRIGLSFFRKNPKIVVASVEHKQGGVFKSSDGGDSWTKASGLNPRPFYFSVPRADPLDENRIYMAAVSMHYSEDAGKTFRTMNTSVHVDHHALWIDPTDSNHLIIGEDGGVGQSRDRGKTWEHLNYMPIGQFYAIAFDMRKPYWVYGGLQDNGTWASPTQSWKGGVSSFDTYTYAGGDGFHVQVDPEDWTVAYAESQGGFLQRSDLKSGPDRGIRPSATNTLPKPATPTGWRFNWSTPFIISPHNPRTLYFGGNKLFKTVNRGDNWRVISPDLSTNDPTKLKPGEGSVSPEDTGAERHCTIITVNESPKKQGLIWVGTDDGLVWVSEDDGGKWTNVTANIPGLPANTWVSRVSPSRFEEGRCYATFDGHRSNDYNTYVYVTEDFGKTWTKLNGNLPPNEPTYVIREGLRNKDLLYIGTEFGMWISFDRGQSWNKFRSNDFPTVPVHDLALHPRDGDLVIGTHGRSIYILPVGALEDMTAENMAKDVVLTKPAPIYNFGRVNGGQWEGDRTYVSANTQPGTLIAYYLRKDATGDVTVTISDAAGAQLATFSGGKKAGLNTSSWNGRARGRVVSPGDYRVTIKVEGKEYLTSVKVEEVADQMNASPPRLFESATTAAEVEQEVEKEEGGG